MNKYYKIFEEFIREIFDLESDRAPFKEIVDSITRNVNFKGTNLWILIFAIIVASVGLNMNSTAVVIGAMLISPLMGPIIGVGLGVGIYDFELIKKSAWNLFVAVIISVITSTIYFWLTPLKEAQSELLGRTLPTIFDVVIAFFGGLAGVVAYTRQEKSNVIPGVAIATALMPPLCTAGYGLATGNLYYFLGAFYLFFINSVFIATATILIVRYLKFPYKEWVDNIQQRKMRNYVLIVTMLTLIPSVYLAYGIVGRSIFNRNATKFISEEFIDDDRVIIDQRILPENREISLFILGEKIDSTEMRSLKNKLVNYNLFDTNLIIRQDALDENNASNLESMKTGIIEEMYKQNEITLVEKQLQIAKLQEELGQYKTLEKMSVEVSKEIAVQYPEVIECSMNKTIIYGNGKADSTVIILLNTKSRMNKTSLDKMNKWLTLRLNEENIKILTY